MTRRLIIEPEAEEDLRGAFAWYEEQRPGLGQAFLLGIEASLGAVRRRPESYRVVHRELRRASVRRFPHGIFFLVEGDAIVVLAVVHAKRDPSVWQQRQRST
jgi:plasmid stabilization system protein ParE